MCTTVTIDEPIPLNRQPVYSISIAAELIGIHERTLHLYEREGLLVPARRGNWRFFSQEDLAWIRIIRYLIHEKGVNFAGLRRMLGLIHCWEVKGCSDTDKEHCLKPRLRSDPCWLVSPRSDRKCYLCIVYQLARKYVCNEEELEVAEE